MRAQTLRRGATVEHDGLSITPHVREMHVGVAEAGHCYGLVNHAPYAVVLEYQGRQYAFDMEGRALAVEALAAD